MRIDLEKFFAYTLVIAGAAAVGACTVEAVDGDNAGGAGGSGGTGAVASGGSSTATGATGGTAVSTGGSTTVTGGATGSGGGTTTGGTTGAGGGTLTGGTSGAGGATQCIGATGKLATPPSCSSLPYASSASKCPAGEGYFTDPLGLTMCNLYAQSATPGAFEALYTCLAAIPATTACDATHDAKVRACVGSPSTEGGGGSGVLGSACPSSSASCTRLAAMAPSYEGTTQSLTHCGFGLNALSAAGQAQALKCMADDSVVRETNGMTYDASEWNLKFEEQCSQPYLTAFSDTQGATKTCADLGLNATKCTSGPEKPLALDLCLRFEGWARGGWFDGLVGQLATIESDPCDEATEAEVALTVQNLRREAGPTITSPDTCAAIHASCSGVVVEDCELRLDILKSSSQVAVAACMAKSSAATCAQDFWETCVFKAGTVQ